MQMRSPSATSSPGTGSVVLPTGRLSPVRAASSISRVAATQTRPSAGTRLPASIRTTSPGTSSSASISSAWPSRRTRAMVFIIWARALTLSSALASWRSPITALNTVRPARTAAVATSPVTSRLTTAAASRMSCMTSRYWRTNAWKPDSFLAPVSRFGPWDWSRRRASSTRRPRPGSTPSSLATAAASDPCQPGRAASCVFVSWLTATVFPPPGQNGDSESDRARAPAGMPHLFQVISAAGSRSPSVERTVEGDGGVDQRQVGEGLGEVAQLLAGLADLLGVQAQVVGVGEHLLQGQPGLLQAAGAGQGVHVPEGADREGPLVAAQAVGGGGRVVAVDQAVGDQLAVHRVQGRQPQRVARGHEPDQRHHQQRGVQDLGLVVLGEGPAARVPAVLHDLVVDPVAFPDPAVQVRGPAVFAGQADHAVKGDPAHEPAVGEVLAAAAGLPDPLVGLVPVLTDPVGEPAELCPAGMTDPDPVLVGQPHRVQQLAVDVELELVGGAVADPDRPRAGIPLQMVQDLLDQVGGAVDPVHDLQRPRGVTGLLGGPVRKPAHERRRLLGEPQPQ